MTEEWRDIPNYEGVYQVSNLGRVKSLERDVVYSNGRVHHYPERILADSLNSQGYRKAMLSKNHKTSTPRICRLVATSFLPNPNSLPQVNHKDENKTNDCVDNLEWCTAKYNVSYGTAPMRRGEKTRKPVIQLSLNGEFIKRWPCASIVERELGLCHSHISRCCKGKLKQTGGYIWQYAEKTN